MRNFISVFLFFSILTGFDARNRELRDAPIESALEVQSKEAKKEARIEAREARRAKIEARKARQAKEEARKKAREKKIQARKEALGILTETVTAQRKLRPKSARRNFRTGPDRTGQARKNNRTNSDRPGQTRWKNLTEPAYPGLTQRSFRTGSAKPGRAQRKFRTELSRSGQPRRNLRTGTGREKPIAGKNCRSFLLDFCSLISVFISALL